MKRHWNVILQLTQVTHFPNSSLDDFEIKLKFSEILQLSYVGWQLARPKKLLKNRIERDQ